MTARTRTVTTIVLALLVTAVSALAASPGWTHNYKAALERAKKTGQPILADFTGSDWCGWCVKLKKEVFNTPEFKTWAKDHVVLLELDFPKRKQQAPALRKQNRALAEKFGIRGFPTILFLDAEGNKIGQMGYQKGGPGPWIQNAEDVIDSYRKSKVATPAESIDQAIQTAKAQKKPLLLVTAPNASLAQKQQSELFAHEDFVALVNSRLVLAHADKYGKDWSRDDAQALKTLLNDAGVKGNPRYLLLDVSKDNPGTEVLFESEQKLSAENLVSAIQDQLPKLSYDGGWLVNFEKARALAAQENRPLLLDFTGSDWCRWCIKLDKEIFSKPAFKQYARDHLVLVKLDFPKKKTLPAEIERQNKQLAQKFGIRGFPTLIILDASGKQIGKMGYMKGGPDPFIQKLKSIVK